MLKRMFVKKPLDSLQEPGTGDRRLLKVLGFTQLTGIGIGAIIGAGVFILTGAVARDTTGPALMLSFLVAAVTCVFAALCYAEFASVVPVVGSAYTYAYATLGELTGWTVGWVLLLGYAVSAAAVAHGASYYLQDFLSIFDVKLPPDITSSILSLDPDSGNLTLTGRFMDLPAVLVTVLITVLLVVGVKQSADFNFWMVALKIAIILFVIAFGIFYVNSANWHPFIPYGLGGVSFFGKSIAGLQNNAGQPLGMLAGAALIFFAYIGFDTVPMYAEEARKPQRDVPLATIASVVICSVLYIGMSGVLTGMVRYDQLNIDAPVSHAFQQVGLAWAQFLISLGALTGIISVVLVTMLTQARLLLSLARDGLIPSRFFGAIHERFRTPWKATIVTGAFVAITATLFPIGVLFGLVSIGILLVYFIVCCGVLVMRWTHPDVHRPFRVPLFPAVPLLGMASCLLLMFSLPLENWLQLLAWLLGGFGFYFFYGRRKSVTQRALSRK